MVQSRFQVFVSSTFRDLREERQIVLQSLLELGCIPVGMELFPAANEAQWEFIKRAIEECDYYLLVTAGKYGSLGRNGVSYTEMEYRFAVQCGKPLIAFLHADPETLSKSRRESSSEGNRKLQAFRSLCQKKLCKMWNRTDALGGMVASSLVRLMKEHPSSGWISGRELETLLAKYKDAQQCLMRVSQINQMPFVYSDRRLVHTVHPNGSGTLDEEFTIIPNGNPVVLYRTRYGFHTPSGLACVPKVEAWDLSDKSPLSVAELSKSEISVQFVVLLDRPSTMECPSRLRIRCHREHIWDSLLKLGQVDNHLVLDRDCDSLTFEFRVSKGCSWKSLRRTPPLGQTQISEDGLILTWQLSALQRRTLGYRICLNES